MKTITLAAVAALLPLSAMAHDGMHAEDAYARSTNPQVGAVFMRLENHREVDCTLTSARSDAADRVELHTHAMEDGVMRMVELEDGITVPAGETHLLERGGDHVMLMGLVQPLSPGDVVTLELDFGDCGTETVEAALDNDRTATHGGHAHGHDHGHDHSHGHDHDHAHDEDGHEAH